VDSDGFPVTESNTDSDDFYERADKGDEEADAPVSANSPAINPRRTINDKLIAKLLQKLPRSRRVPTSERSGYIYILKSPRTPGYLKIGVTTKDPVVRREQWDRCYSIIELHAYTSKVPYASFEERMIHNDLFNPTIYGGLQFV
jgi:T5orf172 domain